MFLPLEIMLLIFCLSHFFNKFLVAGIKPRNPIRSVKKPGVNNKKPLHKIIMPSNNLSAGILPWFTSCCILWSVRSPCSFARYAPTTPVTIIMVIVGNNPICWPALNKSDKSVLRVGQIRGKKCWIQPLYHHHANRRGPDHTNSTPMHKVMKPQAPYRQQRSLGQAEQKIA